MPNVVSPQVMIDGARNYVAKIDVSLDGSGDITIPMVIVNPLLLSSSGPANGPPPRRVRIDLLDWDVQDGLALNLFWGGQGPAPIWRLVGRSMEKAFHVGGLQNNADQPDGTITMTTKSASPGSVLVGTFKIHCVKQP